jgi:1-acyl-sn-glycerol-3-phosphate acyltransferase
MGLIAQTLARCALSIIGWEIVTDTEYTSHKEGNKKWPRQLLIYPHTSSFELILSVLTRLAYPDFIPHAVTIAWIGLFKNPVIARIMRLLGCIPIENDKPTGATEQISTMLNGLDLYKFAISPEGSREYRKKFKTGFYHIAQKTKAVYSIAVFDYEKHIINVGKIIQPSDDYKTDCKAITDEFEKGVPLYPENTFFGCRKHKYTSYINWMRLANIGVMATSLLYTLYGSSLPTLISLACTACLLAHHVSSTKVLTS